MGKGWVSALAAALLLATGDPSAAKVGGKVPDFETGPMVQKKMVKFLEPFSFDDGPQGRTYRATEQFHHACQIMVLLEKGVITAEIIALPMIDDDAVLESERKLLDAFIEQSGIPKEHHTAARNQLLAVGPATERYGTLFVQTGMLDAEVPLLIMAIAKERKHLPFKDSDDVKDPVGGSVTQ